MEWVSQLDYMEKTWKQEWKRDSSSDQLNIKEQKWLISIYFETITSTVQANSNWRSTSPKNQYFRFAYILANLAFKQKLQVTIKPNDEGELHHWFLSIWCGIQPNIHKNISFGWNFNTQGSGLKSMSEDYIHPCPDRTVFILINIC